MASHIGVSPIDHFSRPGLHRSRSHSTPEQNAAASSQTQAQSAVERPSRPTHLRSQSYLSSIDPKPRNATTLPTPASTLKKTSSKLHLPLRNHGHGHAEKKAHKYTQSEAEQRHSSSRLRRDKDKDNHKESEGLPNLVAGLNAERARRAAHDDKHDTTLPAVPSGLGLTRMMSSRSYRSNTGPDSGGASGSDHYSLHRHRYGHAHQSNHAYSRSAYHGGATTSTSNSNNDLRRRATSDPRSPSYSDTHSQTPNPSSQFLTPQQRAAALRHQTQNQTSTQISAALDRAALLKSQRIKTLTQNDIQSSRQNLDSAEQEMRSNLEDINSSGIEITRRLDYGYYNLLEKIGNLVTTIQSFGSLAAQSKQLVQNFEKEATRLGTEMTSKTHNFTTSFETRQDRVADLETRGHNVATRAAQLNVRLENARRILENFEAREKRARKAWGRFLFSVLGVIGFVVVVVLAVLMWNGWWFQGDPVRAGLNVPRGGSGNVSLILGDGVGEEGRRRRERVPEEVRLVLEGIEDRSRWGRGFAGVVQDSTDNLQSVVSGDEGDHGLRVLDEL